MAYCKFDSACSLGCRTLVIRGAVGSVIPPNCPKRVLPACH